MTKEELEQVYDCLDGGFGETSGKLSAHIKALEAESEWLKAKNSWLIDELKQTEAHDKIVIDGLRRENEQLEGENKRLKYANEQVKVEIDHARFRMYNKELKEKR